MWIARTAWMLPVAVALTAGLCCAQEKSDVAGCDESYWIVSSRGCSELTLRGGRFTRPLGFQQWSGKRLVEGDAADAFGRSIDPGVPVCIVVHGSFTSAAGVRADAVPLVRWIRNASSTPVQIVFFSWPAEAPDTGLIGADIAILGARSEFHGFHLARLIRYLPEGSQAGILAHSHGVRTAASALHLLGGGVVQGRRLHPQPARQRLRAAFLAAAIDHHWLNPGARYGRAMRVTEAVLNVRNRADWAIALYPLRLPFSNTALARAGFTRDDRRRLGAASSRIAEIDATRLVGPGHRWSHYYRHAALARSLSPYVEFRSVAAPVQSSQRRRSR